MDAALLLVKTLERAKLRLGPDIGRAERTEVARALLEDALDLCASSPFLRWWVVSPDPDVRKIASQRGLLSLHDHDRGLNEAIDAALPFLLSQGAASATIVPADVPLARATDLRDILDVGETSDVVLVPSGDGGTNALFMRPPGALEPHFGPLSLKAHAEAADALGLRCSVLALPRLALDIDTISDVDALLEHPDQGHARRLLGRLRPWAPTTPPIS